jgi:hypothetical protein
MLLKPGGVNVLVVLRNAHFHGDVVIRALPDSHNYTLLQQVELIRVEVIKLACDFIVKLEISNHSLDHLRRK